MRKPAALPAGPATDLPPARPATGTTVRASQSASKATLEEAKRKVKPLVLERIDVGAASALDYGALIRELSGVVAEIREELKVHLNHNEHNELVTALVDDMVGLGPLESLLADNSVSDIMVNGADQVYVERGGKLELTDVRFQDNNHVMGIATRIVTRIGRRIDESNPICDARLADGSRVNVIAPPLAIDGPSISIRKFSKKSLSLDNMARNGTMSQKMTMLLKIAARSRLNILISGGTGSGKTTLLNALSQLIDPGERIVTIEDAAELQLQQPHVVRLETRPPNLEGKGEVTMRGLVKNSLRMRPDRIILGEVRGAEAVDMLQAMNTGHEGSMCTIHANKPRDALTRLDNMVGMAGINLPAKAVRTQIAAEPASQDAFMEEIDRAKRSLCERYGIDASKVRVAAMGGRHGGLGNAIPLPLPFRRRYLLRYHRCMRDAEPLAIRGLFAHEMMHVLQYSQASYGELLRFMLRYALSLISVDRGSGRGRRWLRGIEHLTDLMAVEMGEGVAIAAWKRYKDQAIAGGLISDSWHSLYLSAAEIEMLESQSQQRKTRIRETLEAIGASDPWRPMRSAGV